MRNFLSFLCISLLVACSDDSPPKADSTDMGTDVEQDVVETPAFMCPEEGDLFCGGRCQNVSINMEHCGECNNRCIIGTSSCNGGECVCLAGGTMCSDGRCYDTQTDHKRCGSCTNACEASESCVEGGCVFINDRAEVLGVLQYTNSTRDARQDCGVHGFKNPVGPLQLQTQLGVAAQAHADDMAANSFMAHEGSDGSSPSVRAQRANYNGYVGENVARGYESPRSVVAGWTDSDGHCQNMMLGDYTELGVGYAVSRSGEKFWVQLFGTPR